MTAPEPTQQLTDEELAAIRGAIERADLIEEDTLPMAFTDRKRLLAEVDRLRAENTAQAAKLDQFRSFPDNPGPGNWSTSYRMGYADAGRDVRALVRALDQSGEGQ